jgi:hypothetical protein
MLTGFFGANCQGWVSDLATQTHAISYTPFYQKFKMNIGKSFFHPSFFLVFAYYRETDVPSAVPDWDPQGIDADSDDISSDMVPVTQAPQWTRNYCGNVNAQSFAKIKMRYDSLRWFPGCYQTFMWLGDARSNPGQGSINRNRQARAQHMSQRVRSYQSAAKHPRQSHLYEWW